jgi:hypothetical protein
MPGRSRRGKRDGNRTLAALPKLRATLASHAANFCALPPPGFAGLRMCGLRVPDRRRRRFGIEAGLRLSRRPKRRPSKMKMEGRGSSWSLAASPLKTQDASGSVDRVVRETSSLDPHTSKSDCRDLASAGRASQPCCRGAKANGAGIRPAPLAMRVFGLCRRGVLLFQRAPQTTKK